MDFNVLNDIAGAAFGETVVYTPVGGAARDISGIFDSRHYAVEAGESAGSSLITSLSIVLADVPGIAPGDQIVARGLSYRIFDLRPDGQGMATALLERF